MSMMWTQYVSPKKMNECIKVPWLNPAEMLKFFQIVFEWTLLQSCESWSANCLASIEVYSAKSSEEVESGMFTFTIRTTASNKGVIMIMRIVIFYSGSEALCSCVVTLRAMKPYIPVPVVAFGREVKLQINSHIENHRLVRARVRLFRNFYP